MADPKGAPHPTFKWLQCFISSHFICSDIWKVMFGTFGKVCFSFQNAVIVQTRFLARSKYKFHWNTFLRLKSICDLLGVLVEYDTHSQLWSPLLRVYEGSLSVHFSVLFEGTCLQNGVKGSWQTGHGKYDHLTLNFIYFFLLSSQKEECAIFLLARQDKRSRMNWMPALRNSENLETELFNWWLSKNLKESH